MDTGELVVTEFDDAEFGRLAEDEDAEEVWTVRGNGE